ncbi:MAG: GNAT family N-acetyltransferase, partial [Candidatus Omnitrophota bacterium]|nr:GNAT family N-acetyltransferase [Candidatus Omnitrophota bacterium]
MDYPPLVGERIYLRRLDARDLTPQYLGWLNDPDVTKYMETGREPMTMEKLRAYWQRFQGSETDLLYAIILRADERHIGNVALNHIQWTSRVADTGLMIGCREFWGKGYAFEAWSLLLDHA